MLYSLSMAHVQGVAAGITWPTILTKVASALAADSPATVAVKTWLEIGKSEGKVYVSQNYDGTKPAKNRRMFIHESIYQEIHHLLLVAQEQGGWLNNLCLLEQHPDGEFSGPEPINNSSSPTMTTKDQEFLSACKQEISVKQPSLNTITKEAYLELLRSTRAKRKATEAKKKVSTTTIWPSTGVEIQPALWWTNFPTGTTAG